MKRILNYLGLENRTEWIYLESHEKMFVCTPTGFLNVEGRLSEDRMHGVVVCAARSSMLMVEPNNGRTLLSVTRCIPIVY